ncbi:MAG: hypothetical protein IPK10_06055 [Bacteroidetes bacterium]|nr:hypothetical protein [Bacteroidota bacterium]
MKLRLPIALLLIISALMSSTAMLAGSGGYALPAGISSSDYMERTIVFRVKPEFRSICSKNEIASTAFNKILGGLGQTQLFKIFPNHQPPVTKYNERGQELVDISLIYELHYTAKLGLVKVINSF